MTDPTPDAVRERLERAEIVASNNLAHAIETTPRNSDQIGALGPFVAFYRDAVRSAERERVVAEMRSTVEGMRGYPVAITYITGRSGDSSTAEHVGRTREESFVDRTSLLASLDAMRGTG